jgi:hypothetical protein
MNVISSACAAVIRPATAMMSGLLVRSATSAAMSTACWWWTIMFCMNAVSAGE